MLEQIRQSIEQAQMVLVGIGTEFAVKEEAQEDPFFTELAKTAQTDPAAAALLAFHKSQKKVGGCEKEQVQKAYEVLADLLKDKNYFVISLYKSQKICIIICSLPFLKRQTSWRRSEAAVTRRTRNAFIGSSRYEGSNPSVSAPEPLVFKGSFVFAAQGRLSGNWRLLSWTKFCHKVLEV